MTTIHEEVEFIIQSYKKATDKEIFKARLKQLFLTNDISTDCYKIAKIMWNIDNKNPKQDKNTESDPCSSGPLRTITLGCN
jgi:hypothetical protein